MTEERPSFWVFWPPVLLNMLLQIWHFQCLNKTTQTYFNRYVGVKQPWLLTWGADGNCSVQNPGAAQRVLSWVDSWLSTSPVVCVLTRQCLYPQRHNTASGPEHPSQPSENPPSPGPGIVADTPDPDLPSLSLPTNGTWIMTKRVGVHYSSSQTGFIYLL